MTDPYIQLGEQLAAAASGGAPSPLCRPGAAAVQGGESARWRWHWCSWAAPRDSRRPGS